MTARNFENLLQVWINILILDGIFTNFCNISSVPYPSSRDFSLSHTIEWLWIYCLLMDTGMDWPSYECNMTSHSISWMPSPNPLAKNCITFQGTLALLLTLWSFVKSNRHVPAMRQETIAVILVKTHHSIPTGPVLPEASLFILQGLLQPILRLHFRCSVFSSLAVILTLPPMAHLSINLRHPLNMNMTSSQPLQSNHSAYKWPVGRHNLEAAMCPLAPEDVVKSSMSILTNFICMVTMPTQYGYMGLRTHSQQSW